MTLVWVILTKRRRMNHILVTGVIDAEDVPELARRNYCAAETPFVDYSGDGVA